MEFIVAEITKNWPDPEPVTPERCICGKFEMVIEHNRKRGYRLHSFQLHQLMTVPGSMTERTGAMVETIIAVFQKEAGA